MPIREDVNKKDCNMYELVHILERAYKHMEQARNQDVVLCAGYTGSGKSTMLSYLMFGPHGLKEEKISY